MNQNHPLLTALKFIGLNIFYPVFTMDIIFAFIGSILTAAIIVTQVVCFVLLIVSLIKSRKESKEDD